MPRASVIVIKNKLLTGASQTINRFNEDDDCIGFDPSAMGTGNGGDAASRRGVWDQWEEEEY